MSGCSCSPPPQAGDARQRRTLRAVLLINAAMFALELLAGWQAQSSGLVADSLDMLADACVYAISLYAVGRSAALQAGAARASGLGQVLLALLVLSEVIERFQHGSAPVSALMMGVGLLALGANLLCLRLLLPHRGEGVHMRASLIFSTSDVIANAGVIAAGALVWLLDNRYPDLAIGAAIAAVVLSGGLRILREAHRSAARCAD